MRVPNFCSPINPFVGAVFRFFNKGLASAMGARCSCGVMRTPALMLIADAVSSIPVSKVFVLIQLYS